MHSRWTVWALPLLAAGLLSGQTSAQRRLVATGDEIAFPSLAGHIPRWTSGRLVGCDECQSGAPVLWSVDRQGKREDVLLEVPGANYVSAWDVASGPDGALVVVGFAISGDSRFAEFVNWISPDRKRQVLTRVSPYSPCAVTVAPDGTIWTVGPMKDEATMRDVDSNVLRHYSPSGQLLATTTIRSTRRFNGLANVSQASTLMASNDRIGWLTLACEYIEFSFSAVEAGRYNCPSQISDLGKAGGVALSSANDLLIGGKPLGAGPLAPLELDRATDTWGPVPVPDDSRVSEGVLGFDGLTLVARRPVGRLQRLTWAQGAPALP